MSASPSPSLRVLQRLLAVEHLAGYAYGLLGGRLSDAGLALARECEQVHHARRDALTEQIRAGGAEPTPAAPGYDLPDGAVVADQASAVRLAVAVEEQVASVQVAAVAASTDPTVRTLALAAVQDAAVRAARWRVVGGVSPVTVPFPGRG